MDGGPRGWDDGGDAGDAGAFAARHVGGRGVARAIWGWAWVAFWGCDGGARAWGRGASSCRGDGLWDGAWLAWGGGVCCLFASVLVAGRRGGSGCAFGCARRGGAWQPAFVG